MAIDYSLQDQELITSLRTRLHEAEATLDAIRNGQVDAVVVGQADSTVIFTLENADRPYRFLIEQMTEGALALSEQGVVLYGNRRLSEILHCPLPQIVGSTLKRFFEPKQWARLERMMAHHSSEACRGEFTIKSGASTTPVYLSITEIVSDFDQGRVLGAVLTDLSEQRQLEARLIQAQKMEAVGQLTGGLAHDFNNLLQAISGNLSLIQMRPGNTVAVQQWADNALAAAERGAKLTSQLLAFSRSQQINLVAVDTDVLMQGINDLLLRTLGQGIEISYELAGANAKVLADKTQLELAILNLGINARDAMPGGGRLCITTSVYAVNGDPELSDGSYVQIRVVDNGAGMKPEVLARAFEPFFTTKKPGEGTGLGLAQVYGIARQAGGAVRIDSIVGQGTAVTILLRQVQSELVTDSDATAQPLLAQRAPRARKILVVDDDPMVRHFMTDSLAMLGYEVSDAADGFDGLKIMAREPHDLLLIDFAMPKINGAEVVKRARAAGFKMPVIFASGYSDRDALNEALGSTATVLTKPFTIDQLELELDNAFRLQAS